MAVHDKTALVPLTVAPKPGGRTEAGAVDAARSAVERMPVGPGGTVAAGAVGAHFELVIPVRQQARRLVGTADNRRFYMKKAVVAKVVFHFYGIGQGARTAFQLKVTAPLATVAVRPVGTEQEAPLEPVPEVLLKTNHGDQSLWALLQLARTLNL